MKKKKKIFNVVAKSVSYYDLEVEAYSEEEAYDIGNNADGADFCDREHEGDFGSWDIVEANEVD
jgi:hypothetical protein